jgi:hypothetical protein
LSTQLEYGGHSPSVADPTGGDHWYRCHRIHHGGYQGKRRNLTPHVPASLPPLRHDHIDSAGGCLPRLFRAADGVKNDSVGVVDLLDVAGGISPHERHDPQTGCEGLLETTVLIRGENQVAAERATGERRGLTNHVSGRRGPRQRQHTKGAGIRDRRREFGDRRHRRLNNRLFNPEQLAHRRPHRNHLSLHSGSRCLQAAST